MIMISEGFFDHHSNFSPGDMRACSQVPRPCFLIRKSLSGTEEVFKVLLPPIHNVLSQEPQYTALTVPCFSVFRCRMVVQNLSEAIRKSFSMVAPNSSPALFFASVSAVAALRLACLVLSAHMGTFMLEHSVSNNRTPFGFRSWGAIVTDHAPPGLPT